MSIQKKTNQKRLLDALDHVDDRYVAELVEGLKLPNEEKVITSKKSFAKSIRYAALVAACALLLGAAIPVANTLIGRISLGTDTQSNNPAGSSGECAALTSVIIENDEDPQNQQTGDAFDGFPIFKINNRDSAQPSRIEAFTADGEQLDLCICNSDPCTCGDNIRFLRWGNMISVVEEGHFGYTVFVVYDISDPNNIKYNKITLDGISYDNYYIIAKDNTPYYYAYRKPEISVNGGRVYDLTVLDMSEALDGKITRRDYPSFRHRISSTDDSTVILGIDGEAVYYGIKDGKSYEITEIARALPGEDTATTLFKLPETWHFGIRYHFDIEEDGTIHFFRDELDENSKYGYSLCHYIWREGEGVEKSVRATDICDYILADGYIYYAVNDPKYSREFLNYDVYYVYTDMTGGIIYRLPMNDLDCEPMVAWTVSEEYYLYGVTENNPAKGRYSDITSLPIFIQGVDGGIALWANKQVGENIMHVNLLIGDNGDEIVMTELAGCMSWGYYAPSDVGGGTNINWEYRPENSAE